MGDIKLRFRESGLECSSSQNARVKQRRKLCKSKCKNRSHAEHDPKGKCCEPNEENSISGAGKFRKVGEKTVSMVRTYPSADPATRLIRAMKTGSIVIKIFSFLNLLSILLNYAFGVKVDARTVKTKVCVIGAGPAGISAARHLADHLDKFEITVFERSSEVGGLWAYTDETGSDKYGYPVYSSLYKHMRTNVPKEIMLFPDWPEIEGASSSCVPHYVIKDYLNSYTDRHKLRAFIRFNVNVKKVKLDKTNNLDRWEVTVENIETSETDVFVFDAIIVCNGYNLSPRVPRISGLESFRGEVLHSHDYRKPENFKNKKVLILGAGSSGIDVAQELMDVAAEVRLSHNKKRLPVSIVQVKGVDKFENGKFILKDNSTATADVLILCTGYNYAFPFLDSSCGITVTNDSVSPLYKNVINVEHPSMSFVGVSTMIIPFPVFHQRTQFIVFSLMGRAKLPTKGQMLEDSKLKSDRSKYAGELWKLWPLTDELADLGAFSRIPEYIKIGHKAWMQHCQSRLEDFKNYNLVFKDDKKVVQIVKAQESGCMDYRTYIFVTSFLLLLLLLVVLYLIHLFGKYPIGLSK